MTARDDSTGARRLEGQIWTRSQLTRHFKRIVGLTPARYASERTYSEGPSNWTNAAAAPAQLKPA